MNTPEDQIQEHKTSTNCVNLQEQSNFSLAQVQSFLSMHQRYKQSEAAEDRIVNLQQQLEESQRRNIESCAVIEALTIERDCLKGEFSRVEDVVKEREREFLRRIDDGVREKVCLEEEIYEGMREREELVRKIDVVLREKEGLLRDIEVHKGRNEELEENFSRCLRVFGMIKECLSRVNDGLGEKKLEVGVDHEGEIVKKSVSNFEGKLEKCMGMEGFLEDLDCVLRMAKRVEEKLVNHGEKEDLLRKIEAYKSRNKELEENLLNGLEVLGFVVESLNRVDECLDENNSEILADQECHDLEQVLNLDERLLYAKIVSVSRMTKKIENKTSTYLEKVKKEKRELERSVMSLTEENRDANALLRIAMMEKEAVEKTVSKLKVSNEQRRVPLLQYAERGLQRVGFGFIIGGASNEQLEDDQKKNADQISDSMSDVNNECEEGVFTLASTVEKMMKNLRFEISQLRRDFENSRAETERLQSLMEKQALRISELTIYVTELENQKRTLTQNVDKLMVEIKAIEEEVERWRKACELEVEASKHVAQEHNYVVAILKQELEKTRTSLQVSNNKLKFKEEVAVAAIAAQSAAERTLQLADSRAIGLQEKIEELTKQVEEAERRHKNRRMCWPWHALNSASARTHRIQILDIRRSLPGMQAFLE